MSHSVQRPASSASHVGRIHRGDCIDLMQQMDAESIDLVFSDPPFNIGYEYDEYHDRQDSDDYIAWSRAWIAEVHRVLRPNGTFWLAIGDEYAAELKVAAQHQVGFSARSWVVWYYTFGVNCTKKFSRSHAHLLHFVKDENDFTFNAEDPAVRVPSARALVYADKRANPAGRLPDDTWILRPAPDGRWVLRPQDLPEGFQPTDDTWYYARVAGTFKQRQGFHGCQMPEQLLGRIIRASSNPGDVVLDPFAGSGTTLAVAKKLGREWIGCELSEEYVRAASERLTTVHDGDPLDGPADPIASAPSTTNGRRLAAAPSSDLETRDESDATHVARESQPADDASTAEADTSKLDSGTAPLTRGDVRAVLRGAIVEAFLATHDGHSTDWMLANPELQDAFHAACRDAGLIGGPRDWNHELLRLRKQGAIPKSGDLKRAQLPTEEFDAFDFAAEIAWRLTHDKFAGSSLDEIFCDPDMAAYFDRTAARFAPGHDAAKYRWAALRLRKASRELVREVRQFHFIFATRDFGRYQSWSRGRFDRFGGQSGVYLLRDEKKQPLLVGLTSDLGARLAQHAVCPAVAKRAAQVAVIAGDQLPGEAYRDAFKEDLVRRYRPTWNVNLVGLDAATCS